MKKQVHYDYDGEVIGEHYTVIELKEVLPMSIHEQIAIDVEPSDDDR